MCSFLPMTGAIVVVKMEAIVKIFINIIIVMSILVVECQLMRFKIQYTLPNNEKVFHKIIFSCLLKWKNSKHSKLG